jgi:RND superfamily putative drug exporter
VFLISRMHEEWLKLRDNSAAVNRGQAITGRTITAAASIMVVVFASFVISSDRTFKMIGLGMAVAVLIDALLIRTVLVPAVMHILARPTGPCPPPSTAAFPTWNSKPPRRPARRRPAVPPTRLRCRNPPGGRPHPGPASRLAVDVWVSGGGTSSPAGSDRLSVLPAGANGHAQAGS